MFPGAEVVLAYGSAGRTMKSNGKGKLPVPTTGVWKSACRTFGSRCKLQDENRSTMVDWNTGFVKHAPYRCRRSPYTYTLGKLGFTTSKYMPFAPDCEKKFVKAYWDKRLAKNRLIRGGSPEGDRIDRINPETEETTYKQRFPEVRGLRFLQETRTYLSRDRSAAGCISRLAAYSLMHGTSKKPAPFCRGYSLSKMQTSSSTQ